MISNHVDMKKTGEMIRGIMEIVGVHVNELADAAGVSEQAVYKWLSGKSLPTLDNLAVLRDILMTGADDLIVWTD